MFSWHSIPFARLLLPLISGITLHAFCPVLPVYSLTAFLVCICVFILLSGLPSVSWLYRFRKLKGLMLTCSLMTASVFRTAMHEPAIRQESDLITVRSGLYCVQITSAAGSSGKYIRAEADLIYIADSNGHFRSSRLKVMLYFKQTDSSKAPLPGDRFLVSCRLRPVAAPVNPDDFDYADWLRRKQILYTAYPDPAAMLALPARLFSAGRQATLMRDRCLEVLRKHIPSGSVGVAEALILGYKDDIDAYTSDLFARSGTTHILAVSGMHAAMIFALLNALTFFIKKTGKGAWIRTICILSGLWFYVFMTGMSASVIRAGVMCSLAAIGKHIHSGRNPYNILYASAFLILLYNPFFLLDAGFQLSYAAVLGILSLHPLIRKWYAHQNRLLIFPADLISISLAAQVFTLPLSLYYFHQFPTWFLLSNLLMVPLFSFLMMLLIALLAFSFWTPVASLLGSCSDIIIDFAHRFLDITGQWPLAVIEYIRMDLFTAGMLYLLIASLLFCMMYRKKAFVFAALALCLLLCIRASWRQISDRNQTSLSYHVLRGHDLICMIIGKNAYILSDSAFFEANGTQKHLRGFLSRKGIVKVEQLNERLPYFAAHFAYRPGLGLQFFDTIMTIDASAVQGAGKHRLHLLQNSKDLRLFQATHIPNNLIVSNKIPDGELKKMQFTYFNDSGLLVKLKRGYFETDPSPEKSRR